MPLVRPAQAVQPVESEHAVVGGFDVFSSWEVAFCTKALDSSELVGVDH